VDNSISPPANLLFFFPSASGQNSFRLDDYYMQLVTPSDVQRAVSTLTRICRIVFQVSFFMFSHSFLYFFSG